jgi:hypothetical protein
MEQSFAYSANPFFRPTLPLLLSTLQFVLSKSWTNCACLVLLVMLLSSVPRYVKNECNVDRVIFH